MPRRELLAAGIIKAGVGCTVSAPDLAIAGKGKGAPRERDAPLTSSSRT